MEPMPGSSGYASLNAQSSQSSRHHHLFQNLPTLVSYAPAQRKEFRKMFVNSMKGGGCLWLMTNVYVEVNSPEIQGSVTSAKDGRVRALLCTPRPSHEYQGADYTVSRPRPFYGPGPVPFPAYDSNTLPYIQGRKSGEGHTTVLSTHASRPVAGGYGPPEQHKIALKRTLLPASVLGRSHTALGRRQPDYTSSARDAERDRITGDPGHLLSARQRTPRQIAMDDEEADLDHRFARLRIARQEDEVIHSTMASELAVATPISKEFDEEVKEVSLASTPVSSPSSTESRVRPVPPTTPFPPSRHVQLERPPELPTTTPLPLLNLEPLPKSRYPAVPETDVFGDRIDSTSAAMDSIEARFSQKINEMAERQASSLASTEHRYAVLLGQHSEEMESLRDQLLKNAS